MTFLILALLLELEKKKARKIAFFLISLKVLMTFVVKNRLSKIYITFFHVIIRLGIRTGRSN